jgi:PAS domain S-box-containing protein
VKSAGLSAKDGNGFSVARAMCNAISDYCKENRRQNSEDMLRKLWHAVEQTADLVVITDRSGVIEYVNPSFAALTGYSRDEAMGQTFRMLKSSQETPELYRRMWQTILAGNSFRGVIRNQKKNGEMFVAEKTITPLRDADGKITHFLFPRIAT